MTKEYLKMADVFEGRISSLYTTEVHDKCGCICDAESGEWARYIAHAINSHDELVAEVERLRGVIDELERENENISAILLERTSALGPYI